MRCPSWCEASKIVSDRTSQAECTGQCWSGLQKIADKLSPQKELAPCTKKGPPGRGEPDELPAGAVPCRGVAPPLRTPTATPDDSGAPPPRPPTPLTAVVSGAWPCEVEGVSLPDCCACAFAKGAKGEAPLPSTFTPLLEGSGFALAAVVPSAALARGCTQGINQGLN